MRPGDTASKRSRITMSQSLGRYSKRSKHSSKVMITIDDLPDLVFFDILLRLPLKSATQCKCVSKHWFALISSHYFLSRFLSLQYDNQKSLPSTLIFWDTENQTKIFSISKLSMFKKGRFSLNFLPRYQSAAHEKQLAFRPVVVGSCNDLVLCCATTYSQRDYYICNPYTKQWVVLPPVPHCRLQVRVGFICEPYYYRNPREENNTSYNIHLNVDYRYAIVRILEPVELRSNVFSFELLVQIFSSETGKWTELVVLSPRRYCFDHLVNNPGLVYKGMLYWSSKCDGYMIGLDPFFNNTTKSNISNFNNTTNISNTNDHRQCHVIDFPNGEPGSISVSRGGCLRMHRVSEVEVARFRDEYVASVWEMKDDGEHNVDGGRAGKWCLISTISLDRIGSENPLITEWSPLIRRRAWGLAFDPNDDDILYLELYDLYEKSDHHIVTCNIRTKTLKVAKTTSIRGVIGVIPFTVPWLPTPVPRLEYNNHKDMHAVHFSNCWWCTGRRERGARFE
ncbi:putative F-box domain-containing protein [Rosa chinensis]|uniref:Putative F-box domain-containing protein n=1 Tax=Rosa chinensis TaxID=74649 RepID=A0A2P6R5P9_ROSCH|nr:putative F-box domain-containing protein [Rosa chinensis]